MQNFTALVMIDLAIGNIVKAVPDNGSGRWQLGEFGPVLKHI